MACGFCQTGSGWCRSTSSAATWERVDDVGASDSQAMFQYYTSFGINLPSSCGASLICRKVVSIGRAGGRQKVVVGIYQMNLISDSNDEDYLFTPFSLVRYVQCGAGAVDPANPAANCPA